MNNTTEIKIEMTDGKTSVHIFQPSEDVKNIVAKDEQRDITLQSVKKRILQEKPLKDNEFAIKQEATFIMNDSRMNLSGDGTLTLTFKIKDRKHIIPGSTINPVHSVPWVGEEFAVFQSGVTIKDGSLVMKMPSGIQEGIMLRSPNRNIELETDAVKGDHGAP